MTNGPVKQTEPIVVPTDAVVLTQRRVYKLKHHEFLRLTKIPSFLAIWAHGLFAATGVFALTVLSRWLDNKYFDGSSSIAGWEWVLMICLIALVSALELLLHLVPSEREKVSKRIGKFFDDNGGDDV